jgi:hypothetical protein
MLLKRHLLLPKSLPCYHFKFMLLYMSVFLLITLYPHEECVFMLVRRLTPLNMIRDKQGMTEGLPVSYHISYLLM